MPLPVLDHHFATALAQCVRGEIRSSHHDRMLYATDASIYQVPPIAVVIPRDIADVEATVRCCAEHGVPILPRGAGTSLAGQTVNAAVVIDLSRHCGRVLEIDRGGKRARIEPGVVLDRLNDAAAPHGLMFGPDVATSTHASVGGMIGNNSAGAHSVLFGRTVEHLIGVDVVLADGRRLRLDRGAASRDPEVARLTRRVADVVTGCANEIDARFPRTLRHVDGYNLDLVLAQLRASPPGGLDEVNLAHLVCGAEGTLGIVVEATVGLVDRPVAKGLGVVAFTGVDEALAEVVGILETGPAAVELIDDAILDLARENLEYRRYLELLPGRAPGAVLYVEYFGDDASSVERAIDDLARRFGDERMRRLTDESDMAGAWKLRKAGEPLLYGKPGVRRPLTFVEDTAVDPERLPEFIRRFREILTRHGTSASYYAHASVGCLHIRPMIDLRDGRDRAAMEAIVADAVDLVREYGGALSGEHGDGRLRSAWLERFYGADLCRAFREIRAIFDPAGLMNPGNITAPPAMTAHLRVQPGEKTVHVPEVETFFRYEHEHGFGPAVELCNGAGVCRRTRGGTMCPSYRATLDERHSTRGRGNALRLAVTGQTTVARGTPAWNDPETLATLDLCLSCKACKSECPSNVDVARLKSEYLAHSYASAGGAPRSVRALGNPRRLARTAAALGPLAGVVANSRPARAMLERVLDIDRRRSLPPLGGSLARRLEARGPLAAEPGAPAVVLLPDCFTAFGEMQIGLAAYELLERLGYRVVVPDMGCCGRPQLSLGLLDEATGTCRRAVASLRSAVSAHDARAIIGIEPSCVSAILDDWRELETGLPAREIDDLATRCFTIEDFIEGHWTEHPRAADVTPREGPAVLLHGHCHQKALWGTGGTERLLRRFTGDRLEVLDAGCCGMAGAFGMTNDHYELSMRIGDLALFPAVRQRRDALIVAPGTSCRHQLRDAVGVEALHPVEMIQAMLGGW